MRTRLDRKRTVVVRPTTKQDGTFKPVGFWYSVDGDWERWCRSDQPDWLDKKYVHQVELWTERMLYIRSASELDLFHEKYKAGLMSVNWPQVANEYDGIEIAPYIWERRLCMGSGPEWYYSWDCASGCIWKPNGVKVILENENGHDRGEEEQAEVEPPGETQGTVRPQA